LDRFPAHVKPPRDSFFPMLIPAKAARVAGRSPKG